jgi:hypothetical protein
LKHFVLKEPTKAERPPSGEMWLHEIKHDGFRVIARKEVTRVRLYSRPGNDLTYRFPLIVESLARLRSRSCIIDGEAVCCDDKGVPSFDRIRYRRHDSTVFLYAFDLIELDVEARHSVSRSPFLRPSSCFLTSNARFRRSAAIASKFSCAAFEAVWDRLITTRWYATAAIVSAKPTTTTASNIK